ncbi:MAG TPA: branched-chain amino acid ABC transporter substrate-binding protein [Myxococcota bacterium]|nr:branched-chain amino acid ABC transporter substrate-binding protein [Myxococcota bacterium]
MRRRDWLQRAPLTLLLTLVALTGCMRRLDVTAHPTTVKIVSSLPRTGSANQQTTPIVNAVRMAMEEAGGRAGPWTVLYEDWDDASAKKGDWDPEVEAGNATRAITDPDVMAYIGPYNSGAAKISMPLLNAARLPMIAIATYPGLTKPGAGEANEPNVYRPAGIINFVRINPADDIQGRQAAAWIRAMGGTNVYVLDDQGLYGRGLADVFYDAADDVGLTVLGRDAIDPKAQEYRSLMTRIKNLNPEWIYFGGTTQTNAGQVIKDVVATGLGAKVMVPDASFDQALIQAAGGANAEQRVFATFGGMPADKLTGRGAAFVTRYRAKYGVLPEAYAVYGYVATQVILDALARVPVKDRDAVRRAILATQQVDGVLGSWSFAPTGDSTLQILSGNVVRDGTFQFATTLGAP